MSVVGDFDGDAVDTIGVVRGNTWLLSDTELVNSNTRRQVDRQRTSGHSDDQPITGHFTGVSFHGSASTAAEHPRSHLHLSRSGQRLWSDQSRV